MFLCIVHTGIIQILGIPEQCLPNQQSTLYRLSKTDYNDKAEVLD